MWSTEASMEHLQTAVDWVAVERGVTEHIRSVLAVAAGSPELFNERYPEFRHPEISLEQALQVFITHSSTVAEHFGWSKMPGVLAQTILLWTDCLREGGYHPVPVLVVHHFLAETAVPSISDEVTTIVARAEIDFLIDQ